MNSERLYCVERTHLPDKVDISEHISVTRKLRAKTAKQPLTDDELNVAKDDGRP